MRRASDLGQHLFDQPARGAGSLNSRYSHGNCVNGETPTYRTWATMVQRCTNPKRTHYQRYGGRGITVCERWRVFANFLADMGERPSGTSLDRYPDANGNYEPNNCRWATQSEQVHNSTLIRRIQFNGEALCVTEWGARLGLSQSAMSHRIRKYGEQRAIEMGAKQGSGKFVRRST